MSPEAPRVLVATVMRREGGSGVQTHVRTLVEHLGATGAAVRVVSPFDAPSPLVRPVFAARLALTPLTGAGGVWWYRHWHTHYLRAALGPALARAREGAVRPPVLYAQCPGSALAALEVRERDGGREPVVMAAHFNVSEADEWAGKGEIRAGGRLFRSIRALEARVLPRLDGLVFVSEAARRDCLARVPAAAGVPAVVVPNAVPARPPGPGSGAADGPVRDLVTVGSLEPRKNQGYLLEVLAEARRRGRPCTLTVVGDGPQRRELERRARDLGVDQDVIFVGHQSDVHAWLGGHRLYGHAALTESFGIALVEAMRAGLPVLAAAVGGIPEVARDGIEGRHWPLDDVGAATDLLLDLLDDPETRRRMARAGAARADGLRPEVVCPRLVDFWSSLSVRREAVPAGGGPR